MSVRDNIMFPLKFKQLPKNEARRRVEQAAAMVQVAELLERRPAAMSGGQQQRVALARALVKQPQLLLLDEPLSNLDATLRLTMRSEIKRLQRQLRVTTILVTHDQIEATTMADRVICMSKGRIEQIGTPDDLYKRPASLFVAQFVGAPPINILPGEVSGSHAIVNAIALPLSGQASGTIQLGIRPENLQFTDHGNGLDACIEQIEPMGRETLYVLDTPLGTLNLLEPAGVRFAPGSGAKISWQPEHTLAFNHSNGRRLDEVRIALPQET
jgi:inositol-phosphate transport system ATP-binding protein